MVTIGGQMWNVGTIGGQMWHMGTVGGQMWHMVNNWRTDVAHGEQLEDRCGTSRHTEDIFGILFGNNIGQMWTM